MRPPAEIGEMRTKVAYEEATATPDANGQPRKAWSALWTGFAAVRPLSAKERSYGGGQHSQATHRVALRWRPGVKHKARFRLVASGRILNIAGVVDVEERNAWLVCQATETVE